MAEMGIGIDQLEADNKECTSLRLSALQKIRASTSPGPIYEVKDTLGPQVLSTYPSAGVILFTKAGGNKGRPIESLYGRGPGPKYQMDTITYGPQVQTRFRTSIMPSFGKSERPPLCPPNASPGPHTAYFPTTANQRGPSPSICGASWRKKKPYGADDPGPGSYNIPPASGKQVLSTKPSYSGCRFGETSVDRGMAKPGAAEEPGPGQYSPLKDKGKIRAISFGAGPQRPEAGGSKYDIKPAPNRYKLPNTMGYQVSSTKRSAPSYSFGAR